MSERTSDPDDPAPALCPPVHAFERERLDSLGEISPHVSSDDPLMAKIACRAVRLCGTEIGLVSLMEAYEERFVGCSGVDVESVGRSSSFCSYAILQSEPLVVEDALLDSRFRDLPCVVGEPHVRFYAGAPILDPDGLPLGVVCALDLKPREISTKCVLALQSLAGWAGAILETRRIVVEAHGGRAGAGALRSALSRLDATLRPLIG